MLAITIFLFISLQVTLRDGKRLISHLIEAVDPTILFNSSLFLKISEFRIFFDMSPRVYNNLADLSCQGGNG